MKDESIGKIIRVIKKKTGLYITIRFNKKGVKLFKI